METLDEFTAPAGHHPGTVSGIDEAFYETLVRDFASWDKRAIDDAVAREKARMLLEREARLLDEGRYEEWLGLFAPQCVYWIAGRPGAADPRREVSVAFDDRRRLEDRIEKLEESPVSVMPDNLLKDLKPQQLRDHLEIARITERHDHHAGLQHRGALLLDTQHASRYGRRYLDDGAVTLRGTGLRQPRLRCLP